MSLKHQLDVSLADYLNSLSQWDSWGERSYYVTQRGSGDAMLKADWPPAARPSGASADGNVFPKITVDTELEGEVQPHTGILSARVTVRIETQYESGYCYFPTGSCDTDCTDRGTRPDLYIVMNGYWPHTNLCGYVLTNFIDNQSAWTEGIEAQGRGVRLMDFNWTSERSDFDDAIMATELGFDAVGYWNGVNSVTADVPEGSADSLQSSILIEGP
tara:strand:+ start:1962 stop:2609 length:648 start_codon:yes stop_codon:yes gene_type:complete